MEYNYSMSAVFLVGHHGDLATKVQIARYQRGRPMTRGGQTSWKTLTGVHATMYVSHVPQLRSCNYG